MLNIWLQEMPLQYTYTSLLFLTAWRLPEGSDALPWHMHGHAE